MTTRLMLFAAAGAAAMATLAGCGLLTAPASVPAAIAENSSFDLQGTVVDAAGKPLDGVIVRYHQVHHFWTPVKGSADVVTDRLLRIDHDYRFDERGSLIELDFSKEGYFDTTVRLDADHEKEITTGDGVWPMIKGFPVVMVSNRTPNADLARFNGVISYSNYPMADCISINNLATEGRSGDVKFVGKDARDATVFPPGTLYLTLDREPPLPINSKGDIDPRDLDIPHHITLHLPGPAGSGFLPIDPKIGFHPLTTTDEAPAAGYVREYTINRDRLKAMRVADPGNIMLANEFFFFHAGTRFGKGKLSWSSHSGTPEFRFELYVQPLPNNRDLTWHKS